MGVSEHAVLGTGESQLVRPGRALFRRFIVQKPYSTGCDSAVTPTAGKIHLTPERSAKPKLSPEETR